MARRLSKFQMLHAPMPDVEALEMSDKTKLSFSMCCTILKAKRRKERTRKDIEEYNEIQARKRK